jgi:hypothetical protein
VSEGVAAGFASVFTFKDESGAETKESAPAFGEAGYATPVTNLTLSGQIRAIRFAASSSTAPCKEAGSG